MPKLQVTFQNICLHVLTDLGLRTSFIEDDDHEHVVDVTRSTLVVPAGTDTISLAGRIAGFSSAGNMLAAAPSYLTGGYASRLVNLQQVAPGSHLEAGWDGAGLVEDIAAKVLLPGGDLIPQATETVGGQKRWRIGENVKQLMTDWSTWEADVEGEVQLVLASGSQDQVDSYELSPDADGVCRVTFLARQAGKPGLTLELVHGVAFVTEFMAFDKAVRIRGSKLPIPHTYWPDYRNQTDPEGGPCNQCVVDLRTATQNLLPR